MSPSGALFEQIARVGKALGSAGRLAILDALSAAPRSVGALSAALGIPLGSVSAHLQVLRAAGLVATTRHGTSIEYRLADAEVEELWLSLRDVAASVLPGFEPARREVLGESAISDPDRLLQAVRDREAVLVDLRPPAEFAAGHLRRAVRLDADAPAGDVLALLTGDQAVVVQSRGPLCPLARAHVRALRKAGAAAFVLDLSVADLRRRGFVLVSEPAA